MSRRPASSAERFLAAAVAAPGALPVDWQPGAVRRAEQVVAAGGVLLLGEVHGVAENAAVVDAVLGRFGVRQLSLEWPPALRTQIEAFAAGLALDLTPLEGWWDGRFTGSE